MIGVEDEIELHDRVLIAAESWSKQYDKTPDIHTDLIKSEARLTRIMRKFFRDLADKSSNLVSWNLYQQSLKAYSVDVIVTDDGLDSEAGLLINLVLEQVAVATALGAQSGDELYGRALGLTSADAIIQKIALEHSANLVGKTVTKDGKIVPNPKAGMNILETTRQDIRQSVQTSLALGETVKDATERLRSVINNPYRAEMIARTETVNSFGQGLSEFGRQTEAVGKEWQDVGASDECADNTAAGPIPFDDTFPSGDTEPAAHPNCRCSMRLIYQNELDDNPNLFD